MSEHAKSGHHHVPSAGLYFRTFMVLLFFMAATILAAFLPELLHGKIGSFLSDTVLGSWIMNLVAMTIAVIKAWFVITIFMGVKHGTHLTKAYASLGFIWMCLILIMFIDYGTRPWEEVRGWEKAAPTALPRGNLNDKTEFTGVGEQLPVNR